MFLYTTFLINGVKNLTVAVATASAAVSLRTAAAVTVRRAGRRRAGARSGRARSGRAGSGRAGSGRARKSLGSTFTLFLVRYRLPERENLANHVESEMSEVLPRKELPTLTNNTTIAVFETGLVKNNLVLGALSITTRLALDESLAFPSTFNSENGNRARRDNGNFAICKRIGFRLRLGGLDVRLGGLGKADNDVVTGRASGGTALILGGEEIESFLNKNKEFGGVSFLI